MLTDMVSEWHFWWFEKDGDRSFLCTTPTLSVATAIAWMRATVFDSAASPWHSRSRLGLRVALPRSLLTVLSDDMLFSPEEQAAAKFQLLLHAVQHAPGMGSLDPL